MHKHRHTHRDAVFSSEQKSILRDQIMQTLFEWLKRMRIEYIPICLSGHDEVAGQQSTWHKDSPLALQGILMHAEVLCWLGPKLGTAPRPAGTHNCDSTTCTDIHEIRA